MLDGTLVCLAAAASVDINIPHLKFTIAAPPLPLIHFYTTATEVWSILKNAHDLHPKILVPPAREYK